MTKAEVQQRLIERQRLAGEIDAALPTQTELFASDHVLAWRIELVPVREGILVTTSVNVNGKTDAINWPTMVRRRFIEVSRALLDWEEGKGGWPMSHTQSPSAAPAP